MVLIQRSSMRLKRTLYIVQPTFECPNMTFDTVLLFSYGYLRFTDPTEARCITVLLTDVSVYRTISETPNLCGEVVFQQP